MRKILKSFMHDQTGAAMVEYSILIGLITAVVIASIIFVGTYVDNAWSTLQTALTPAA